jgi:hypothetical protein
MFSIFGYFMYILILCRYTLLLLIGVYRPAWVVYLKILKIQIQFIHVELHNFSKTVPSLTPGKFKNVFC